MLLALDAGNTNITIGAFLGGKLSGRWRLRTIRDQTPDEWGILMRNLFSLSALDLSQVHGVVISSVVPAVDLPLTAMAERYFQRQRRRGLSQVRRTVRDRRSGHHHQL